MPYKVLKPIPNGDGTYHQAGEIVPADGWRNLRQLINGRYLIEVLEAAPEAVSEAAPTPKKRRTKANESAASDE